MLKPNTSTSVKSHSPRRWTGWRFDICRISKRGDRDCRPGIAGSCKGPPCRRRSLSAKPSTDMDISLSSLWLDLLSLHGYITDHRWMRQRSRVLHAPWTNETSDGQRECAARVVRTPPSHRLCL